MTFFNLFKKKKRETIIENEIVSWKEFNNWFLNKKKEIEKYENDFFIKIKDRINIFISEINIQILRLQQVDISDRKVEERVKYIVRENLGNYILYLDKFVNQLKKIENGKNFVKRFNFIFTDFEGKSKINFAKANFLVGKEMEETKDILRKFLKDIENIVKENSEIINTQIIQFIEEENTKMQHIENTKFQILKAMKEDDVKISNLNENIKTKNQEIITLKSSKIFLNNEKIKKELIEKEKLLEKEIDKLKETIDFKALTNFYHSFEKEMALVKECKENFKQVFKRSKENKFVNLIEGANLLNDVTLKEIKKIDEKKKEIENIIIEDIGYENIQDEIEKMKSEIEYIYSDRKVKEKKLFHLNENLNEIKKIIENKLKEIKIDLE
jgi:hypothetical protein